MPFKLTLCDPCFIVYLLFNGLVGGLRKDLLFGVLSRVNSFLLLLKVLLKWDYYMLSVCYTTT
jgi:hypothetical protein